MIHFRNNKTEKEVHRKMSLTWDQKLGLVQEKWSQDMIHFCHDHDHEHDPRKYFLPGIKNLVLSRTGNCFSPQNLSMMHGTLYN